MNIVIEGLTHRQKALVEAMWLSDKAGADALRAAGGLDGEVAYNMLIAGWLDTVKLTPALLEDASHELNRIKMGY